MAHSRRSQACLKMAAKQRKSKDPLDQALAEINQIVGLTNQRMESLDTNDMKENADRNLDAYLTKYYNTGGIPDVNEALTNPDDLEAEQSPEPLPSTSGDEHVE